jgi:NDP-sugar pyrophosphorylase family protein
MNGDLVPQFDVERMLHHHKQGNYQLTIGAHDYRVDIPYGVIQWDEKVNRVNSIVEKPEKHFLVNGGIYIIDPKIIALIESDRNVPITELIDACIAKDIRVGAHLVEGDWIDVGHHKQLAAARGI